MKVNVFTNFLLLIYFLFIYWQLKNKDFNHDKSVFMASFLKGKKKKKEIHLLDHSVQITRKHKKIKNV